MRSAIAAVFFALTSCTLDAQAQTPPPAPAASAATPTPVEVKADGLVGLYYAPPPGVRRPAMLVLGGSEGGLYGAHYLGAPLARQGYAVLGLAYFGAPGLPANLQDIPLEYFTKALAWLKAQPGVDPDRIGVYGISKGGELALLLASRHPEIKAVIAGVPSSVVWQGINMTDFTPRSSFDEHGRPVPFLPYDTSRGFTSVLDLYQRSLAHAGEHPDALIPVEQINGAVLLISGGQDLIWPSNAMSDQVMARLDAKGFRYPHQHLNYPEAGHGAGAPPSDHPDGDPLNQLGGTAEANAQARGDMWVKATAFLKAALKP
jgi:dienelactone hydrolase